MGENLFPRAGLDTSDHGSPFDVPISGAALHCFFLQLGERSPTSLALTLALLRHNEGRAMEEVYAVDSRAARFMVSHHDFLEGVRARIIDKNDKPQWRPQRIEDVDLSSIQPQIFAA